MRWWDLRKLKSSSEKRRLTAIGQLAKNEHDPEVIASLVQGLTMWESRPVRLAAAQALAAVKIRDNDDAFWDVGTISALRQGIAAAVLIERDESVLRAEIDLLYGDGWFSSPIYQENEIWLLERAQQFGDTDVAERAAQILDHHRFESEQRRRKAEAAAEQERQRIEEQRQKQLFQAREREKKLRKEQ